MLGMLPCKMSLVGPLVLQCFSHYRFFYTRHLSCNIHTIFPQVFLNFVLQNAQMLCGGAGDAKLTTK
jgi:hypothetical protein